MSTNLWQLIVTTAHLSCNTQKQTNLILILAFCGNFHIENVYTSRVGTLRTDYYL